MEPCPCGSGQTYDNCCEPMIQGKIQAETAEQLLRSRYSAHVKAEIDYIYHTTHSNQRSNVNREQVAAWSKGAQWLGLEILDSTNGLAGDESGTIEFVARYREKDKKVEHREIAEFKKEDGLWRFSDGQAPKPTQVIRKGPKVGRNDPCPCGSGKKFKKCCAV